MGHLGIIRLGGIEGKRVFTYLARSVIRMYLFEADCYDEDFPIARSQSQ